MKKKIISFGIISMFLLVGVASATTSTSIQSSISSEREQEQPPQPGFPDPLPKHIKGYGTGIAFKVGRILFMIAKLPDTTITCDVTYNSDPDTTITMYFSRLMAFGFTGNLVKDGSSFEFEGDCWLTFSDYYIPPE